MRVHVPGIHHHVVWKGRQAPQALVHRVRVAAREVGSSAAVEKQRVAGDKAIRNQEALAAGRVTRGVQERHGNPADGRLVAGLVGDEVLTADGRHLLHPLELVALHVDRDVELLQECRDPFDPQPHHRAADMVRVVMGCKHPDRTHPVPLDGLDYRHDVIGRVHQQAFAGLTIADNVHEVDHLAGELVVDAEVPSGEQLPKVQAIVDHHADPSRAYSWHVSAELRYAVVGTGMMGLEHINALLALRETRVVAVCDPHGPSVESARRALGDMTPMVYSDVRDLVAAGGFDVAVVATPNHTHRRVLEPLLESGVHLLVEKPLCISVAECREVVELERRNPRDGRVVWVGLEYRYMSPTMRLLRHARSGDLGRLRMLAIREHRFPFLRKIGDWNRFSENTGGTLVEKCCHFFDLMRLLLGTEPVRVYASGAQDVNHLDETYGGRVPDILDNAFVVVDFADGARASLDLCMFAEATRNEQEISLVGDRGKAEALVTEGVVRLGLRSRGWFQCDEERVDDDVPESVLRSGSHHGSSWREHVAMQAAIRAGSRPEVTLHDGLMSVAMGEAAHRSIARGRPVVMEEVLEGRDQTSDS